MIIIIFIMIIIMVIIILVIMIIMITKITILKTQKGRIVSVLIREQSPRSCKRIAMILMIWGRCSDKTIIITKTVANTMITWMMIVIIIIITIITWIQILKMVSHAL